MKPFMAQKQKRRSQATDRNALGINVSQKHRAHTLDPWDTCEVSAQFQDMRQNWERGRNTIVNDHLKQEAHSSSAMLSIKSLYIFQFSWKTY